MAPVQTIGRRRCPGPVTLLMAFAVWLLAVPGCEQKEEEPVFKLQSPAVDVEVKKSDKGVDVEVKGKGRDE